MLGSLIFLGGQGRRRNLDVRTSRLGECDVDMWIDIIYSYDLPHCDSAIC